MSTFLAGVFYRLWAIRALRQYYSHRVQTVAQPRIVASGSYRFTRHPAYAGMIIAHAGISMYFSNWVTSIPSSRPHLALEIGYDSFAMIAVGTVSRKLFRN